MKNNISLQDLKESIDYFKEISINEGEMFYFFLLMKSLGFNENISSNLALSNMPSDLKETLKSNLYLLGGTFNHETEDCEKYGLSFPSGIYELSKGSTNNAEIFYQPGSNISNLSRVRDTVKNYRGKKFYVYDENTDLVKFKSDYIEIILKEYLGNEKVSLKNLIGWAFKFIEFETTEQVSSIQFTSILKKRFIKIFKLTKRELFKLFEDDLYTNPFDCQRSLNTGEHFRTHSGLKQYLMDKDGVNYNDIYTEKTTEEIKYEYFFTAKSVNDLALQQSGENLSPSEVIEILKNQKQIIITGVPGTGKSFYTREIENSDFFNGKTNVIQFHPNYTYENFIGGDRLTVSGGATTTSTKKGVFIDFIEEAKLKENRDKNYLFIIDEINRGSIANVFGETILMLDREYSVNLAKPIENIKSIAIPDNVYIIGTMNTSDRNIAFLDLAIRRRFAFIPLLPNYEFLTENVRIEDHAAYNLGAILKYINDKIIEILKDENLMLGQSYFIPRNGGNTWNKKDFHNQFNYVLIPTLFEYSYNQPNLVYTIIGDLSDQVQDLDLFYERFNNQFSEYML